MVRNSSFELLRVVSIFLIVMCHVCALLDYESASFGNQLIVDGIRAVGSVAVSCFVLISGYFSIKFKWDKFISLIVLTTIYCTMVAAFRYNNNPIELVKAFLTVPSYSLWFIACYLILMLLAPYINLFTDSLDSKDFTRLIVILVIIFSVLPTLTIRGATNDIVLRQGGKNLVYMLFLYIVGRYVKLQNDRLYNKYYLLGGYLGSTIVAFVLNLLASNYLNRHFVIFTFDCSPLTLFSSLCVFYIFKSWDFQSKVVNWFSASVFAFYLLSDIYYFFDSKYIHLSSFSADNSFVLYMMLLVFFAWLFSMIVDKTLGSVLRWALSNIKYVK